MSIYLLDLACPDGEARLGEDGLELSAGVCGVLVHRHEVLHILAHQQQHNYVIKNLSFLKNVLKLCDINCILL